MLDTLITSKTRIKLLLKFFLNSKNSAYLRNLESEFGESTNAIRGELNRFEEAGLLTSNLSGNKKLFRANTLHPLFYDLQRLLMKYVGLDQIIDEVVEKLGDVKEVYLSGELSRGKESHIIDLIFVGDLNKEYLLKLIDKAEETLNKKIRYIIYTGEENFMNELRSSDNPHLLLWTNKSENNLHEQL